jgi:hypothetical protein
MSTQKKIDSTVENWEKEVLGADIRTANRSELTSSLGDEMLGLQAISIRLEKSMISDMKEISKYNGLSGYQPLMRRVLNRFVEAEMKKIARDIMSKQEAHEANIAAEAKREELATQKCA